MELGWPDALHLSTGRLLSQFGRLHAMPFHGRCPLPALVFRESLMVPGSWPSLCVDICASSDISLPGSFGISSSSSPSHVRSWFRSCVSPRLDQSLRDRLCAAVSSLSVFHVDLCSQSVNRGPNKAMVVRLCLPTPGSWVSAGGATTLSQVVLQPATSVLRFHACSAVLLWAIWHTAFLSAQLSQISEQNGAIGLCLVGLRDVLGSSFLDLQSQVFSELHGLHPCIAHVSFFGQVCERFVAL